MPAKGLRGYKWELQVASEAEDDTFEVAGKASDVTIDQDAADVDVSTRDGNGWEDKEQGLKKWSCALKHLWVPTNAAYLVLKAAWEDGSKVLCEFNEAASATGVQGYDGSAIVTKLGIPQNLNGSVFVDIELKGKGALTAVTRA